jgi:mRNA interferase MazF
MVASVKRGDVHYVDLEPVVGSEQGGRRPAVVIQNDVGNEYSPTTIIAIITSRRIQPFPFIVALPDGTLPRPSVINCAQVRTVDRARLTSKPIASLDHSTMRRVDEALRISLGLY